MYNPNNYTSKAMGNRSSSKNSNKQSKVMIGILIQQIDLEIYQGKVCIQINNRYLNNI